MTSTVKRNAPPPALIRLGNPWVRMLLRSPLRGMLDSSVLLLHVTGRRTGRTYDIPVSYVTVHGRLTIVTVGSWRLNLRGGAYVDVTLHGRRRRMRATLDEDPSSVAVTYRTIIDQLGWPKAGRHLGISVPGAQPPTVLDLKHAASEYGWSVITVAAR
jgi:F420H(2)-dependent quinone reductase